MRSPLRPFLFVAAGFAVGLPLSAAEPVAETPAPSAGRPNVLLFYIDDLRPQTADYGHERMVTPNFTRLAESGVRFENAYCQVPTCGASRASLMTGLYPTRERFPDFLTWAERDAPNAKTLPQRFKEAGYTTISNGKIFHHPKDTADRSWSETPWKPAIGGRHFYNDATAAWMKTNEETRKLPGGKTVKKVPMWEAGEVDPLETSDGLIAAKTMADLDRLAAGGEPFFLACGLAKPHMPFFSPEETYALYPRPKIELAEYRDWPQPKPAGLNGVKEQFAYVPMTLDMKFEVKYNSDDYHRRMQQGYSASVSHADDLLGRVTDKLEQTGLAENTVVVVLGDHGWLLGEHNQWAKNTLLHDALRTALWMSGPGVARGAAVPSYVEFVDLHPTLCELAGVPVPEGEIHGRSFAAVLQDPSAAHRDHAYTRFKAGDSIASADYHYVRYRQPNGERSALLIDRKADPLGKKNHAGDPAYAAVEADLNAKLDAKLSAATGDRAGRSEAAAN
ncbi:sulfatase [Alienimonas californiensis]|uniref:Choline-sulfatase n=1 Tax=Alienimonas californiensis TaxID=2527989 RepID=A0A517P657_9PLAN|nr:sulfatase [Alienimonas californiensis]QDT14869.1 Choline-sulfatase [Alienimonas californiensis]